MASFDLLSIGGIYLDVNSFQFPFENGLAAETETVGSEYEMVLGGSAVNIARATAVLELKPVFVGKIGQDLPGKNLQELMSQSGIHAALITDPQVKTSISMNYTNPQGKTLLTTVGNANQSLTSVDILEKVNEFLPQVKYLYLGAYFKLKQIKDIYEQLVDLAHTHQVKVVVDHGRIVNTATEEEKKHLKEVVKKVDIYLPSEDEFIHLWGPNNMNEALDNYRTYCSATAVIKQGERGATGVHKEQKVEVPAFPITPLNTVGAGDTFNAGFLRALENGTEFVEAIRFGCATAALKVSTNKFPTIAEVTHFMNTQTHA